MVGFVVNCEPAVEMPGLGTEAVPAIAVIVQSPESASGLYSFNVITRYAE
jgi:hypothetical protein